MLFIYRLLVGAMVLFGALTGLDLAWVLADITMGLMTFCNLVAVLLLGRQAFMLLNHYKRQKKAGITDPLYKNGDIPELAGRGECW